MPLNLSKGDVQSPTWLKVLAYYEDRLAALRLKNDSLLPEPERALLCGQIQEIKALLDPEVA